MRHSPVFLLRLLYGAALLFFALNRFAGLLPLPVYEGAAAEFYNGLLASAYLMPLVASLQLFSGLALLTNRLVPLALVILAPVTVNILLFHLLLDPAHILPALGIAAGHLLLLLAYRRYYRGILSAQAPVKGTGPQAAILSTPSVH